MKKKKILFFIKLPPPCTGVTRINSIIAKNNLIKKKFTLKIIHVSYVSVISKLGKFTISKIWKVLHLFCQLLHQLIFFNPKIVYFQISPLGFAFIRDFVFIFLIKLFKKKILFHLHGKGIDIQSDNLIYKILYKFAFKNEYIICLSNILTFDIKKVYTGAAFIVSNAIEDTTYRFKKKNNIFKICFISNLIKSKGIYVFFEILKHLKMRNQNFKAYIIGAEVDMKYHILQAKINEAGLSKLVNLCGAKYGNDKMEILSSSDLFVFPTLNDVWGLVVLEAMQIGIPVIASNEGAIPDMIKNGLNGYLIEKGNALEFANKIQYLIENPEIRIKMGKESRRLYEENFTEEKMIEKLINVFNTVLGYE